MFLLTRPSQDEIASYIQQLENQSLSYPEVGATRSDPPSGYDVDHNCILIGKGEVDFERAKRAVCEWRMFDVPGLTLCFPDTPIEVGRNVAPLARHLGFYSLNSCRIVYVIDEPLRFGFAYGTLKDHAESGEERFTVELNEDTGEVWYDVFAFSKPGSLLVKLGYPYARYRQKQFGSGSKQAMKRAIEFASDVGS